VTCDILVEALKQDRSLVSLINDPAYEIPNSLRKLIKDSEAHVINLAESEENVALTNLIIRTRCEKLNQYRDMIRNLTRLISLQGSLFTHEIVCRDEDDLCDNTKTTNSDKLIKEERARKLLIRAPQKNKYDLMDILSKREKDGLDKQDIDYAFARAIWGEQHLNDVKENIPKDPTNLKHYSHGVIPHVVLFNKTRQKQFLQLCLLLKPNSGFANPKNIISEMAGLTERDVQDQTVLEKQRLFAYCNILKLLEFSDPNDCSLVDIRNVKEPEIYDELDALKSLKTRKRKKSICDPLKSIQGVLVEAWGISPKVPDDDPNHLRLMRTPTSLCFPEYSYERYEEYNKFKLSLKPGSQPDLQPDSDSVPENFIDVIMSKKAQQTVNDQQKKQQENRRKKTPKEPVRNQEPIREITNLDEFRTDQGLEESVDDE